MIFEKLLSMFLSGLDSKKTNWKELCFLLADLHFKKKKKDLQLHPCDADYVFTTFEGCLTFHNFIFQSVKLKNNSFKN
jgi:hypothetical protein